MTWILLRDIEPGDMKQEDTIYDVGTFPHVLKGEWSDEQVEQAAQEIKENSSQPYEYREDDFWILHKVKEFLPTPIRDAL